MKKSLLVFLALLLTAAVVTATMLNGNKKTNTRKEAKRECPYSKTACSRMSPAACY